jgi:hypothetical protein
VDRREVQEGLRGLFARWGLPGEIRIDNGTPWGSWADLPPELALWLIGLDIDLIWNRPRHSTDNAVIERAHGVCQRWIEPHACPDLATLQERLDQFTALQRETYPAIAGQSRLAAYPALAHSGRPYDPTTEAARWDERRVWTWLGERVWTRRVDQVGRISLYNRAVGVGRAWAGTEVTVQVVARGRRPCWVIRAADGTVIREQPAPELRRGRIRSLTVTHRRPPSPTRSQPPGHAGS